MPDAPDPPFALPDHWQWTTLGAIRQSYSGSVDPSKAPDQTYEHYSVPSFEEGRPVIEKGSEIGSAKKALEPEMVLLCKINPRINRVWKVSRHSKHPKIGSTEWIRFPKVKGVDPDFLCYGMRQHAFRNYLAANVSGVGGSLMRAKKSVVDAYPFPLPPLEEQRRIVAKIEELFSNLDAGTEALAAAARQLARYRQSVLHAAVEGRLTAAWRRTHAPDASADALLARILDERRARWEAAYRAKYEAKGKTPPRGWKKRYKPPEPPDTDDLPALPEGWVWVSLDYVYDWSNGDSLPQKDQNGGPYPVYGGNGVNGHHDSFMLDEKAIVVGRVGAHCGNVHVSPPKSWITDNAIYSKSKSSLAEHQFMLFQLQAKRLNRMAGGSGQPYLSQKKLNSVIVAFPPLAEQRAIVAEVERLLSVADDAAATVARERARAGRLRQSLLKRAFAGRLVPPGAGGAATAAPAGDGAAGAQMRLDF
jgi:type I restriction enzyme S subunit